MTKVGPGKEILRTERLILRRFRAGDVARYFAIYGHPSTEKGLGPCPTISHAWRHMAYVEGNWSLRGFGAMCITKIGSDQMIGLCGPTLMEGAPGIEIAWTVDPELHGQGFAAEAAAGACRWIFNERPTLDRVLHYIDDHNKASQVVAKKIGGLRTDKIFEHPIVGPLPIWVTPRAAFF
ncbi:MAG: GNAT family N-acetyltransferase [Pseudomonadota bacterium]